MFYSGVCTGPCKWFDTDDRSSVRTEIQRIFEQKYCYTSNSSKVCES